MSEGNTRKTRTIISLMLIGSLVSVLFSGCFLQPVVRIEREFNFVDYDAPALRLAEPIKARLLAKDPETGKWRPIGKGIIPAGAYIKGRAPKGVKDAFEE